MTNTAIDLSRIAAIKTHSMVAATIERLRADERGEGVISTAIAVLIMAFIGAAAFGVFRTIMAKAADKTTACLDAFTSDAVSCK